MQTSCSNRSAAAGLVIVVLATAFAPGITSAQSTPRADTGVYLGGSVGVYLESSEGHSGAALAGGGIIGYRFGARWAIQGEVGGTGTVYCYEAILQQLDKTTTRETICHRDAVFSVDAVRRFRAGSLSPYVTLGLGMGVHAGVGIEIPFGRRLAVAPALDVNLWSDMLAVRPKVALLVRF